MSRPKFYADLLERSGWTFVQAFAAQLIASGLDIAGPVTRLSIGQKAAVAAIAGAVAVAKSLIAPQLPWTATNSASVLPETLDPPAPQEPDPIPSRPARRARKARR